MTTNEMTRGIKIPMVNLVKRLIPLLRVSPMLQSPYH